MTNELPQTASQTRAPDEVLGIGIAAAPIIPNAPTPLPDAKLKETSLLSHAISTIRSYNDQLYNLGCVLHKTYVMLHGCPPQGPDIHAPPAGVETPTPEGQMIALREDLSRMEFLITACRTYADQIEETVHI